MEGPGSHTGPSQRRTTKRLTRRPLTNYRKTYGKVRGGTLPELGGNFRLCAVDQKRPFFPRAGPFLDLLPFKGPFSLTGALTGPPYGKAPYGEASYGKAGPLQEAPYEEGRSLREGPGPSQRRKTKRLTGRQGPYGKPLTRRDGPYEKGRSLMEGPGSFTGPSQRRGLREGRALTGSPLALTGRPTYGKASYEEASYRKAPYREASYGKAPDGEVS